MSRLFRLVCCLCRRSIAQRADVYVLDAEWQRRYPQMVGSIACGRCALEIEWSCTTGHGGYVDGHIPVENREEFSDFDSWCHIRAQGTQPAIVIDDPWSGVVQGAGDYLRSVARRPGVEASVRKRVQTALDEWDTHPSPGSRSAGEAIRTSGGGDEDSEDGGG